MKRLELDSRQVWLRCFLCGRETPIMLTKSGRPYSVCACGVQTFFRTPAAIALLEEAARHPKVDDVFLKGGENAPLASESR